MRLRRLDLTRFGKFTDRSIDFGERAAGAPDFHIVYGPNEAGKSTALVAFLDLLFKIEPRSRYDFLHPYPTMRIGACLDIDGTAHEFVRVKRSQNSLLDAAGMPIAEGFLASQLGGIDRDAYRAMFSLDDETLEAGGESILASKGDLGQLLFSATAGLSDLSRTLMDLRAETEEFYKPRAHAGGLQSLKAELSLLRDKRDQIDTAASKYARLAEARDRAQAQYKEALAERTGTQTRMIEVRQELNALPRLTALREAREKLLPLADLPPEPSGWRETLPKLHEDATKLSVQLATVDDDVKQKAAELEALTIDRPALEAADHVADLDDLHARYITAEKDIPERQQQVDEETLAIAGILGRVGRSGDLCPRNLLLAAAKVESLRDLIEQRSGIDAAVQAAARELSQACQRRDDAGARLQEAGGDMVGGDDTRLALLDAAMKAARGSDHASRRRTAASALAVSGEELSDALRDLHPWIGDVAQLAALPVPDSNDLQRWKTSLAAAQKQNDACEAETERTEEERQRLTAECNSVAEMSGIVGDQEAARIRADREAAWAHHRRTLDLTSADAFEYALRRDDLVMTARLRHQAEFAKLQQIHLEVARIEVKAERARAKLTLVADNLHHVQEEIAAAVAPCLPSGTTLTQREAWLEKRGSALACHKNVRQAERDLREADADGQTLRDGMRRALASADVKHAPEQATIDELCVLAQASLDQASTVASLRAALADRRREVQAREEDDNSAATRDRAWRVAWAEACSNCWLAESDPPPSVATVREILQALTELGPAIERRASLRDRIEKMQQDQRAFADAVGAIGQILGYDSAEQTPLDLAATLRARVAKATADMEAHTEKTKALAAARAQQCRLSEAQEILDRREDEMTTYFAVDTLTDVAVKLSDTQTKIRLEEQFAEATRDILDALRLESIDEAERTLDAADRLGLETEFKELEVTSEAQDQRTRDLYSALGRAADQMEAVGGDAAVARIEEERRTILLQIEEDARRYLRLRAGIAAAEHALRSYRQTHRGAMLLQASEAFRTISRDAYRGLESQPDKGGEVLIAVASDGSSKIASDLSKGTRFQLYLALRVAGYHEFARQRTPVPFIADDIMETFDDFRAEEALRLLTNMAKVGQVIHLTHHRHLCDLARLVCPGVKVHTL